MANKDRTSRQAVIDDIRKQQKATERRKGNMIIGVAVIAGLLIIGAAAWKPISDSRELSEFKDKDLASIGAPATVCQDVETKEASGSQDHVPEGTPLEYEDAPPAFGQHYDIWDSIDRKFYTDDRPDLGELVHNLEHGYTLLWYDESVAEDEKQMETLRGLASKFDNDSNFRNKFKVVPWRAEDGGEFPDGASVAMTHWSIGGAGTQDASKQVGVWQYCSEPSGEALEKFMLDYPYMDSPEPDAI
ncbi:DUF3105 domain-containing protein [Nocardioides campestrisoli]|uniref:DUF3105 domain-containing protein n=1 Tax=Nocardioides campestrisoli TaxID=2736757 RepID=UPI001CD4762E|nr:DUF3105 domain-containing protein [Nocardioides campestrisoli]